MALKVVKVNTARARATPGKSYKIVGRKPPLGEGGRFKAVEEAVAKRGKVRNPAAVVAAAGRKKYGAKKFAQMAAAGRKKRK